MLVICLYAKDETTTCRVSIMMKTVKGVCRIDVHSHASLSVYRKVYKQRS